MVLIVKRPDVMMMSEFQRVGVIQSSFQNVDLKSEVFLEGWMVKDLIVTSNISGSSERTLRNILRSCFAPFNGLSAYLPYCHYYCLR